MTVNPILHPSPHCPPYQSSIDKYTRFAIKIIDMEGEEKFQKQIREHNSHPVLGPKFKKLDQFI